MLHPYSYSKESEVYYSFVTDTGAEYSVLFDSTVMDLDLGIPYDTPAFQISINKSKLGRGGQDRRIMLTVYQIISTVFAKKPELVLIYTCSQENEQHHVRHRMFNMWFDSFPERSEYIKDDKSIPLKGDTFYASLLIRQEHDKADELISWFERTIEILSQKS